ncbi:Protein MAK16-like protein [Entamoeba marina]
MQSDDLIWLQCQDGFCSFKVKNCTGNFCRNRNNVMGQCRRLYCPLANSVYATIREFGGHVYLFTKSIERAHTPQKMWNHILLDRDYMKALETVNEILTDEYNPKLVHRVKQRLTKVYQYLAREKKLETMTDRTLERLYKRGERLDINKAEKAERMAKLDFTIKDQLIERLKQGTYGEMYEELQQLAEAPEEMKFNEEEIEKELEAELVEYEEEMSEDIEDWADNYAKDKKDVVYPDYKKNQRSTLNMKKNQHKLKRCIE